jgi:hypothetical protein
MRMVRVATNLVAAMALCLPMTVASAQTPFYQGRTLRVVVGFPPGGGTDLFGRVVADGLAKHVAGKPSVVVQNMPGAGSVIASNYFSNVAPRDGGTVLIGTGQLLLRILLGLDGTKSRADDFTPIIASPMGRVAIIRKSAGITNPKQLLDPPTPLVLGVPEVIATLDTVLGLKVLDAKFRAVMGYPGKVDTRMALERGEVNLDGQTTPLYREGVMPMVKSGIAEPLFAQGLLDKDKLVRDPAAPEIPTVAEVYEQIHGKPPAGPAWEAYKASVRAFGNGGKILMAHPNLPPAAMAALEQAADAMAHDAEFLARAETVLEGYGLQTGQPLKDSVSAIGQTTPETVTWLRDLLSNDFNMQFK